ncbi:MAG TPA: histidine triad nucleotide-binding protein [Limnochordia bacterium]|nr:histidine triad nucleotide-binding protein [Limnochordia bacterium]
MSTDCLFCNIANGLLSTEFLLETDQMVAFRDLHPVAPTHILVIPKRHIKSLADIEAGDGALLGAIMLAIKELAREEGLEEGFRVVANTGTDGGQSVHHLHFHLLGGRSLQWPPG